MAKLATFIFLVTVLREKVEGLHLFDFSIREMPKMQWTHRTVIFSMAENFVSRWPDMGDPMNLAAADTAVVVVVVEAEDATTEEEEDTAAVDPAEEGHVHDHHEDAAADAHTPVPDLAADPDPGALHLEVAAGHRAEAVLTLHGDPGLPLHPQDTSMMIPAPDPGHLTKRSRLAIGRALNCNYKIAACSS